MGNNAAPERIWVQDAGDYAGAKDAGVDVSWCDQPIDDADTEYVRLDLHTAALAEANARIAALEAGLQDCADALEKFVDTDAVLRKPYEHPLSAYDRARALLDGGKP